MLDQDDDFVSVSDFARYYYYELKWQVVPLSPRTKIPPKDFPLIEMYKGYLDKNVFEKMWGSDGRYVSNYNCGVTGGSSSGGLFVIDLDTEKPNSKARGWWDNLHSMRPHPETPTQITGSGGTQIFFKMPKGMVAFNHKSAFLNVDFQGEGAYVVLPPSIHPNGNRYRWVDGMSPEDCELMELPDYLISEIKDIIGVVQDGSGHEKRIKTNTPDHQVDPWGKVVDGREDLMTRMVFKSVLEIYRDCPIFPSEKEQSIAIDLGFQNYVDSVEPRIYLSGFTKEDLLEKEGRGRSLYENKWHKTIKQWDKKISHEAANIPVRETNDRIDPFAEPISEKKEETSQDDDFEDPSKKEKKLLKLYTLDEVDEFLPPKAVVQDIVAENTLGFIYGPPGCGKTFVALSMGLSVAYGFKEWLFNKKIERSGPVIYISLEGRGDIKYRTQAWRKFHNVSSNNFFRLVLDQVNFMNDNSVHEFVKALDDFIQEHPKPVLIFIDTVSRAIAGNDENDQKEMSKFVETCDKVKMRYSTSVVGVHHSGRAGTNMRGSTVLDGGADFMLRIERDKENENMEGKIHAEKIKAYPDGWSKAFRLIKMDLDAFGAHTSLVATWDQEKSTSGAPKPDVGFGGEQETGFITIGKKLPDYVWKVIFDQAEADWLKGVPWSEFKQAGSRYAGKRIMHIVHDHLGEGIVNESDSHFMVEMLTGKCYLVTTDYVHNKMTKKGLKVEKRP